MSADEPSARAKAARRAAVEAVAKRNQEAHQRAKAKRAAARAEELRRQSKDGISR